MEWGVNNVYLGFNSEAEALEVWLEARRVCLNNLNYWLTFRFLCFLLAVKKPRKSGKPLKRQVSSPSILHKERAGGDKVCLALHCFLYSFS